MFKIGDRIIVVKSGIKAFINKLGIVVQIDTNPYFGDCCTVLLDEPVTFYYRNSREWSFEAFELLLHNKNKRVKRG